MKKRLLKLSVLFVALFIGVIGANAAVQVPEDDESCQLNPTAQVGGYNMTCQLKLHVSADGSVDPRVEIKTGDEFVIKFSLKAGKDTFNITNNEIMLTAATGWEIDGEATKTINIKEDGSVSVKAKYVGTDTLAPETYIFAQVDYQKDDTTARDCGFAYGTPIPERTCKIIPSNGVNHYYGLEGIYLGTGEAAENQYYKECFSCKTPETSGDGEYHGLDGKVTDQATYEKECTNICKIEDDKYYCQDGAECTKEEYENECAKNEKQGSFLPYAGIAAGIALIGVSTILVKKQTKLRKI